MSPEAIDAFNNASGTTVSHLSGFFTSALFVIAIFWGVILLVGKIKALTKDHDIDVIRFLTVALQILAVLVIVLLLVNV